MSTRPRRAARGGAGSSCPASARSRAAMERCARSGSTSFCASAPRAGVPLLGICLGMQLAVRALDRARRRRGPRAPAGRGARAAPPALKLPQIGWNEVRWERPRRGVARGSAASAPASLPRAQLRRRAPTTRRSVLGTARVRRAVRLGRLARLRPRRAVPPREVLDGRARAARQLRPLCAGHPRPPAGPAERPGDERAWTRDPLPGDRHPRRPRRAAAQGDFDASEGLRRGPLAAARGVGGGGRAPPARRRPRRRPRRRAVNLEHVRADRARAGRAGPVRRRAAHGATRSPRRSRPARARRPRHRGFTDASCSSGRSPSTARSVSRLGRRARRAGRDGRLDADHGQRPWRRSSPAERARRAAASSTPTSTATGCSRASTRRRCARAARRQGGAAAALLGRDRLARRPRALAALGHRASPA